MSLEGTGRIVQVEHQLQLLYVPLLQQTLQATDSLYGARQYSHRLPATPDAALRHYQQLGYPRSHNVDGVTLPDTVRQNSPAGEAKAGAGQLAAVWKEECAVSSVFLDYHPHAFRQVGGGRYGHAET